MHVRLASHCPCDQPFNASHAFSCPKGGLPSIGRKAIKEISAQLLTEVSPNVCIEPVLQPHSGEMFLLQNTNLEDCARVDLWTQNVWDRSKRT